MSKVNLNNQIENDHSINNVLFKNIRDKLKERIKQSSAVLGCVYNVTHFGILSNLSQKHGVSLIVNKDVKITDNYLLKQGEWGEGLLNYYNSLPTFENKNGNGHIWRDRADEKFSVEPIRCVGEGSGFDASLMHNKFLIFFDRYISFGQYAIDSDEDSGVEVWTGSFNLSDCSDRSLENVVIINDIEAIHAYINQYFEILKISEPRNWK